MAIFPALQKLTHMTFLTIEQKEMRNGMNNKKTRRLVMPLGKKFLQTLLVAVLS